MQTLSNLRIHQVAELTGVPEPTLRAWERRYGVPTPRRTDSGYRLYGPAEIEQVREMRRLCETEGMAASDAARVVLKQTAPAEEPRDPYADVADLMVQAALAYDGVALDEQLHRLLFLGSTTGVIDRVIAPALRMIGDKWHAGEIDVAQEHFFSQRVDTFLRDIMQLTTTPSGEPIVLACVEDELHEIGLLALAARLSAWGYRPIYLGARTPASGVKHAVRTTHPSMVALSMTVTPSTNRARTLLREYKDACGAVPLLVGGPGAVDTVVKQAGAISAPDEASALRAVVRKLVDKRKKRHR